MTFYNFRFPLIVFLSVFIFGGCQQAEEQGETQSEAIEAKVGYRFPAEFEPHQALWIGWSTYENKSGLSPAAVHLSIIRETAPFVPIKVAVQDSAEAKKVQELLVAEQVPHNHVSYQIVPHADIWFRDMGPNFLVTEEGELKMVDFNFNVWGYEDAASEGSEIEDRVDRIIAQQMGLDTLKTELISEGGDREFNGKGTMLVVEAVERQRNPNMSLEEMEAEFKRVLGVENVVWLKEGLYEDDLTFKGRVHGPSGEKDTYTVITTGGHIDEFCRFVSPNTILLAEVTPEEAAKDSIMAENYGRLQENLEILQKAKDQDGNPFKIVRMPLTESIYDTLAPGDGVYEFIKDLKYEDGHSFPVGEKVQVIAATSYLNFIITNGLVLAQGYWKEGMPEEIKLKDEEAVRILQEIFPERKIVTIDAMAVNIGGGGLHCITQQEPAIN